MNTFKSSEMLKVIFLLVCCFSQQILAGSIVADIVIASIIKNILKPRFVPLPIPIPLPIKFQKHTHKPYPVPLHGPALAAHPIGHGPLSFHLGGAPLSLAETYPSIHHLPAVHDEIHSLKTITTPAEKALIDELVHKAATPVSSKVTIDDLIKAASPIEDKVILDDLALKASTPILDNVILGDFEDGLDLLHGSSNHLGTIHHDIESIGGFDLLTDLDEFGTSHAWW